MNREIQVDLFRKCLFLFWARPRLPPHNRNGRSPLQPYQIHVLQNYVMSAGEAADLAHLIEKLGPKTLSKIPDVSARRVAALPMGALVLNRLIEMTGVAEIIVSANGVREGLLFDRLNERERKKDPLIAGAMDLADRLARFPEHYEELSAWTSTLFAGDVLSETPEQARLRKVACILADIGDSSNFWMVIWVTTEVYWVAYASSKRDIRFLR